jgi:AcrR family transcriptional regulator
MAKNTDTKQRILDAARELFISNGVVKTSMQEIATRLGISKPAPCYHYSSREDIVRSITGPLIDEGEDFVRSQEALGSVDPRALLEGCFDFHQRHRHRHRHEIVLIVTEYATLTELGLVDRVLTWRGRPAALLLGPEAPLDRSMPAVLALGGLQDCTLQFPDTAPGPLRAAAVAGALAALESGAH